MEKILSVIIPTFNMEVLLPRCLDSLVVSEDLLPLLEVLIVNDGSTDKSSEIAHRYACQYPEVFKVIDKENGHYGSCINAGLKAATGKYVRVLDSDDYYDNKNLNAYLELLTQIDVDLVISNYQTEDKDGNLIRCYDLPFEVGRIMSFIEIMKYPRFSNLHMHEVAYRRINLVKLNYVQTEGIMYTDQEWMLMPMTSVQTVYNTGLYIYHYFLGREGQSLDKSVRRRSFSHMMKVQNSMLDIYRKLNPDNEQKTYLIHRLYGMLSDVYYASIVDGYGLSTPELYKLDNQIKEISLDLYNELDTIVLHRFVHYHYVKRWRLSIEKEKKNSNYIPVLFKVVRKICVKVLKRHG